MTSDQMLEKIARILVGRRDPCTKLVLITFVLHGAQEGATIIMSTEEIAAATGLPTRAVERVLTALQQAGLPMQRIGFTATGVPDA